MKIKVILAINILLLILTSLGLIYLGINYASQNKQCLEANLLAKIEYIGCYDALTKNVSLKIKRLDSYDIKTINVSFVDTQTKEFIIKHPPKPTETGEYLFESSTNPKIVYINLNIGGVSNCNEPKMVLLGDCHRDTYQNISSNISSTDIFETPTEEKTQKTSPLFNLLSKGLVKEEMIWITKCESIWTCGAWEKCERGVQRRDCVDKNLCLIPTNTPEFAKSCDGSCTEKWSCKWSKCENGYTRPTCNDLNNCNTKFFIPDKLRCNTQKKCTLNIECSNWSECNVRYNFNDLLNDIENLNGITERICKDKNGCIMTNYETKTCSVRTDIYINEFELGGINYLEIRNKLTDNILALVKDSRDEDSPSLDISF